MTVEVFSQLSLPVSHAENCGLVIYNGFDGCKQSLEERGGALCRDLISRDAMMVICLRIP